MNHNKKERFYNLDLLRFLAAISVVIFHYTFRGYPDNMSILSFPELTFISKYGYLGVNIFFMISGFVILLSTYSGSPKKFIISRFTRLYPTFWIAVLLTSFVGYIIGTEMYQVTFSQIWFNFTMIPSSLGVPFVDGVYWTLLIELKFYMLIVFVMVFKLMKHIKMIAFLWILLSILFIYKPFPYMAGIFFPQYSSYFIAGAMFFLIRHEGVSYQKTIILLLSYVSSIIYALNFKEMYIKHYQTDFSAVIIIASITSFYLIMYFIAIKRTSFFNMKVFYFFGVLTYPIYLIHQNIGYMLFNYFGNDVDKYLLLFIVTATMIIFSYLIHIIIENKLSSKLKKWLLKIV